MKTRLLAVLLVSTLVLASTAPVALAQVDRNPGVQYVDCSQVQIAFGSQYGNANATAVADSEATAEVAQELNISQNQVNACLGGQLDEEDEKPPVDDPGKDPTGDPDDENTPASDEEALAEGEAAVDADTIPKGELPNTGGPSLLAAAVGVVLIIGGASLIRTGRGR